MPLQTYTRPLLPEVESRTQGSRPRPRPRTQKISRSRPRTDPLKAKDQAHRRTCSPKKKASKKIFRRSYLRKPKKKSLQIFRKVSSVFQRNFNGSKIVLSSSRGHGNFRELEASRPRPRTSKCVLEAKDVHEDSISGYYFLLESTKSKKK